MTRVAVVGAGAIGGAVAAALSETGRHKVTLCVRQRFGRLEVRRGESVTTYDLPAETDPASAEPSDFVVLATKAYDTDGARPWLQRLCGKDVVVAVLQNGVDHVERVQPLAGPAAVVPVVVLVAAERVEPGVIVRSGSGRIIMPDTPPGRAFAALFDGSTVTAEVSDDFLTVAWWKLMINAATGAIGALTVRRNGVLGDPEVRRLALALMEEVAAVGRAQGARLDAGAGERAMELILKSAAGHWSSITQDRREGRPLEWEARNAVVGRHGRHHGIPTPLNDAVTTLLRAADPAWEGPAGGGG